MLLPLLLGQNHPIYLGLSLKGKVREEQIDQRTIPIFQVERIFTMLMITTKMPENTAATYSFLQAELMQAYIVVMQTVICFIMINLEAESSVYLVMSHVKNFVAPKGTVKGKTKIGQIGGKGGDSSSSPYVDIEGSYIHTHSAILDAVMVRNKKTGRLQKTIGPESSAISFEKVFCK